MNFNGLPPVGGPPNPAAFFNPPAPVNPGAEFRPNRRPFSSFSGDGTTTFQQDLPNGLPNNMFSTDDYTMTGYDDGNDQGDPKRRRIARACDMCRKKKIKCDGKMPACSHCENYKTECIFTQVEKKRNPPKGAKYIEGLENRLGRMEALLRLSGILSTDNEHDGMDLQTLEKKLVEKKKAARDESGGDSSSRNSSPEQDEDETPAASRAHSVDPAKDKPVSATKTPNTKAKSKSKKDGGGEVEEVEAISEAMCSLVTNDCGETRYVGSSSGFSIFSPKGIDWVNEKTGDKSFQQMIGNTSMEDNKWIQWKPDVFGDIFQRRVYKPLPPKAEALSLLKDYFAHFNCMFPLFHEPTFMHLVDKHYSEDPYEGSGWWASLNVALAIAHRLRVMSNLVPASEDQQAWGYMKNALAVQSELTIRNTDLLSIQALLGISLFLLGTPNPQPSFFLVAAAIRLAHSIGLHKKFSAYGLNPSEVEQRKRVFWIAYMLDKDICLRSGRPPIQDDDDMNIDLPSEDPPDNIGNIPLADGKGKVNLFRLMCTFAVIASKVYKNLYSVKASKQSDGELLNTIGELDHELEEWKDNIPIDFRPEHEIKASHTPLILHVVVLHFAYYNCLTTIHRMSVHHGFWTSRLSNYAIQGLNVRPLNPRVFSSAALCVSAARASIHLIKYVPQGDYDCVWMILYYPVSALVTLFANILQNPQDSRARSDLKLMSHVVQFLSILCTAEGNGAVHRMLSVCTEFERISRVVIDNSDKDSSRRKRKQPDTSSSHATPAQNQTPKVHHATSPTPQQPGNIPNVFSPPSSMFLGGDKASPAATSCSGIAQADAAWASPRPGPSSPMTTASTPTTIPHAANGINYAMSPPDNNHSRRSSVAAQPINGAMHNGAMHIGAVHNDILHDGGMNGTINSEISAAPGLMNGMPSIGTNGQSFPSNPYGMGAFGATEQLLMGNAFQHPFMPQDMWQMPMDSQWDWADLSQSYAQSIDASFGNGFMTDLNSMQPPNGDGR